MMQANPLSQQIQDILGQYQDTYLNQSYSTSKALKSITISEHEINIEIKLAYPHQTIAQKLQSELLELLKPLKLDKSVVIKFYSDIACHVARSQVPALRGVKNIIAVGSGKGGVGKSTIAINLALGLARDGASVGILDADIYGPSQPTMLGVKQERPALQENKLIPIRRYGLQSMSIGYLVKEVDALVWRGPMLGKALQQLAQDTAWEELDYLIVDLPPGTGDVQLTLCQKIPVSGAVIVTTPQDLALADVRRACEMFNKLDVPILGVIENMSSYCCSACGHVEPLFGEGGGLKLAEEYQVRLLASIPLNRSIQKMTDEGYPPVVQDPESSYANAFCEAGRRVAATLSLQPKNYASKFPKVVVKHGE